VPRERTAEKRRKPGPGLIYTIALNAIVVPGVLLFMLSSIPANRFDVADLRAAAGRGEFLIPVMILCAEAIRCWTYEYEPEKESGRAFRKVACVTCVITGAVCFAGAVIAAALPQTPPTERSLVTVTIYAMYVAALAGFIGVCAAQGSQERK
jgi:hypothetical protein